MLVCLTSVMMRLSHRQSRLQFQTRLHSGHADGIFSSFPHPACVFPYLLASYLNFDPGLLCLLQVNLTLKLDLLGARPALDARSRPLQEALYFRALMALMFANSIYGINGIMPHCCFLVVLKKLTNSCRLHVLASFWVGHYWHYHHAPMASIHSEGI